ncbi:stalk domain-containing protein [Paenibacillus sp. FA6]|uniref:stalk domain-containing protein n=1 Tax=Paenibacillus sp. FA6 TaxID=3413029 RepID=UPI003F6564F0
MKRSVVKVLLLTAIISTTLCHGIVQKAEASAPIEIMIDGQLLHSSASPIIKQSTTLVPMRSIFEALGATVKWENATRTVTGTKGSTAVVLKIDSKQAHVNNQTVSLDVPSQIVSNSTMVPLRFIATALGAEVRWDSSARKVIIATKDGVVLKQPKLALEHGSSPANVYDVGTEVEKEGWIYFVGLDSTHRESGIFKMRSDGTGLTKLTSQTGQNIQVIDNHIYFIDAPAWVNVMNTDGSGLRQLKQRAEFPNVVGHWLYYSNLNDKYRLYKLNLDNGSNIPLTSDGIHYLNVVGEWAYFAIESTIYKIKTNGQSRAKVMEEKYDVTYMVMDSKGEYLYYSLANYGKGGMWKISTDGKQKQKLSDQMVGGINEFGEWLYFAEYSNIDYKNDKFYRMKKDGSSKELLIKGRVAGIVITGEWLYYNWLAEDDEYGEFVRYKMKLDGTQNQAFQMPGYQNSKKPLQKPVEGVTVTVNGNELNEGTVTYQHNGLLHVSLPQIVEAMGDTYEWNEAYRTGYVTLKDGTKVEFSLALKNKAIINGKEAIISSQTYESDGKQIAPKVMLVNGDLYVPWDTLSLILKYPVKLQKATLGEELNIGKR